MISQFAISYINELKDDNLNPTVEDIIKLNALGLKVEFAKKKYATSSSDYLPRIASISDSITFRQPTIGHEIWINKAERYVDSADLKSMIAVSAFALSRPLDELPDVDNRNDVIKAIQSFCDECKEYTYDQIKSALEYVMIGANHTALEYPLQRKKDGAEHDESDEFDGEDWKECIAVGVLNEGKIALYGCNQKELEQLTRRQLEDLIKRAYIFHQFDLNSEVENRQGEFYSTLDCIRERLITEKEKNG